MLDVRRISTALAGSRFWLIGLPVVVATAVIAGGEDPQRFRGRLGEDNPKIRRDGKKVLIWAGGGDPRSPAANWYDFTGAPLDPAKLQFGIGKDRIPSIDDPVFVKPDDRRLMKLPNSPYRKDERPKKPDDIHVTGYVVNGEARAFPIALLDFHELVNTRIGGKPVTVGW